MATLSQGFCFLLISVVLICLPKNAMAQASHESIVEVDMPLSAPEDPHFSPQPRKFAIYALSGARKYRVRKVSERYDDPQNKVGYSIQYAIYLPPGRYSLRIKDNEDYLIPSFSLRADCDREYNKKVWKETRDNYIRQAAIIGGMGISVLFGAAPVGLIGGTAGSGASAGVAIAHIYDADQERKECYKEVEQRLRSNSA